MSPKGLHLSAEPEGPPNSRTLAEPVRARAIAINIVEPTRAMLDERDRGVYYVCQPVS